MKRFGLLLLAWLATLVPLGIVSALCVAVAYGDVRYAHGAFFLWLMVIFGLPIVAAVRALFAAQDAPAGEYVDMAAVPRLAALLRETAAACGSPEVHKVLLTDDFNCGIVQRARHGVLFSHENYLVLGLPLLLALTPEQFTAVLAHEYGHISRRHGRFLATIYSIRSSWLAMLRQIARRTGFVANALLPFYRWFVPAFDRASAGVARDLERESDRIAENVAGRRTCAEALVSAVIRKMHLTRSFWLPLRAEMVASPEPPIDVFERLSNVAAGSVEDPAELLAQHAALPVEPHDAHPTLSERLNLLDMDPGQVLDAASQPIAESAFAALFSPDAGRVLAGESKRWYTEVRASWREGHNSQAAQSQRLQQLDDRASKRLLTPAEAKHRALLAHVRKRPDALVLLKDAHRDTPEDPYVTMALGEALLRAGEPEGPAILEALARSRMDFSVTCYNALLSDAVRKRDGPEAERRRRLLDDLQAELVVARRERAALGAQERFEPHGLDADALTKVEAGVRGATGVAEAYLVRRLHERFPDTPSYFCAIVREPNPNGIEDAAFAAHVRRSGSYPDGVLFQVVRPPKDARLLAAVGGIAGACIYRSGAAVDEGVLST